MSCKIKHRKQNAINNCPYCSPKTRNIKNSPVNITSTFIIKRKPNGYGFTPPDDIEESLRDAQLIESHKGKEYSDYWMQDSYGNNIGFVKMNTQTGTICDIQVRASKCGYGTKLLELIREELPDKEINVTGMVTPEGKNFVLKNNIPISEEGLTDGRIDVINPMRFVNDWDTMTPTFKNNDSETRSKEDIPISVIENNNNRWKLRKITVPAGLLSRQGDMIGNERIYDVEHNDDNTVTIRLSNGKLLTFPKDKAVKINY